jgi:hypothetical protein
VGLVGAASPWEPGYSPEMDGGTEQNPAYGTALTFIYSDFVDRNGVLTLTHTLTDLETTFEVGGSRFSKLVWRL